ncbi:DUF3343 domain-containing protein [Syntrophomonas wolfei]|uniref:DUF3343 domain-containing protein n=1 Tax=Syntrophomonas wolfei TaxID=863 RepID=UPI0023F37CC4|nr:DUF3343 domain-containing protein [Syntrophomonas wolfei]
MYLIFYSTNDVYEVEELLRENGISFEIVPTPLKESIYCGVCIKTEEPVALAKNLLKEYRFKIA